MIRDLGASNAKFLIDFAKGMYFNKPKVFESLRSNELIESIVSTGESLFQKSMALDVIPSFDVGVLSKHLLRSILKLTMDSKILIE